MKNIIQGPSECTLMTILQKLNQMQFEVTLNFRPIDEISLKTLSINTNQNNTKSTDELLPPVLTPKQIQEFLGISQKKTYEFLNSGELHVAKAGRMLFVSRAVFLEWLEGKSDQTPK